MATTTKKPRKTKAVAVVYDRKYALKTIKAQVAQLEKVVQECEEKGTDPRLEKIFIRILKERVQRENFEGKKPFDARSLEREYTILVKLVAAWSLGATDAEAAGEAFVSTSALSRYLQANKELAEYRDELREKPIMTARRTVIENLSKDYGLAFRFLQAKRPKEFSLGRFAGGAGDGGRELGEEDQKEVDRVFDLIRSKKARE